MLDKVKKDLLAGVLLVAFALSGSGCDDRLETHAQGAVSDSTESAAVDVSTEGGRHDEGFSVSLLPPTPTVSDALQAVFSGESSEASIRWMRNGEVIEGQTGAVLPAHSFLKGDTITMAVSSDAGQAQASTTIVNSPPKVVAIPFANPFIVCGADINAEPQGMDEDGDPVRFRYRWTINSEEVIGNDSPLLSGDRFCKGDRIALEVIPYDEDEDGEAFRGKEFTVPNSPPNFITTPPLQFKERIYSYEAHAVDPDGDRLAYSLEDAPSGMTIDNVTGDIRWPIEAGSAGDHHVRIAAKDNEGMSAFQEFMLSLKISSQEGN